MRNDVTAAIIGSILIAAALPGGAAAQTGTTGAVVQTAVPPIAQKRHTPPLALSDSDRDKIRQALDAHGVTTTFTLKETKSAKDFNPTVGAKIPKSLKPHALPAPLINQIPALKQYTYLKLKQQVLIVDPMTRDVVDMFPAGTS